MDLLFDWEEERDRYSFEDSDRFEDDSFCSWVSEPESLCNNWRGWRKPTGLGNVSTGGNFGVPFFQTTFSSTLAASVNSSSSQPKTTADVPLLSLVELTAKAVARYIPFEVVEHFYPPIPEQLQLRIAFWSFPENEDDIRLYSCLANGSADEFVKGEFHYKTKVISDVLQIGFHLSGSVAPNQFSKGPYSVAVTFDRRHITSCTCTCNSTASWCSHVVALCLFRIHQHSNVCLRAPVSESLSRLGRDQLQKFAQYLISELPQHFLPTAQRLLDELLSSQRSDINTVCGAPDPTAGPSASEQTTWCLDETALHENIKKTLVKFCIPSPVVLSDVNYLSSNSPPAATEYQSLLRPLRGREPEGIWNLLLIIREMFKRNDSNSIPLLEILTEEILECDMILTWWYNNKTSASLHSTHQHPNHHHHNLFSTNGGTRLPGGGGGQGGSSATQHAASSLCDELVALWRLASLNPSLTGSQQLDLSVQLRDYHSRALEKLYCRNRGQYLYSKEEMELFSGFKPAVEACLLDWGVFKPDDTTEGALRGFSVAFWIKSLLKIKSDGEAVKIVHAKTIHNKCNIGADSNPSGGQGVLAENKPPLLPFQVSSFSSSTLNLRSTAAPGAVPSNIFLNNLSTPFPFRGNNEGAAGGSDHLMDVDGLRNEKATQFLEQSYFADVRKMTNMQEIKFAVAEALYAHGHLAEASALARELALEMLASCQVTESNQQTKHSSSESEKRKRTSNPAFQMLANASFLCTVLLENPENNLIAFKIGIYGLEMNRPPAPTKQLEVKLAYQESELASQLKKIPLTAEELNIIRDRAEKLKDGRIKSRGEAMLPVTLAMFIFDSLCLNSGNKAFLSSSPPSSTLPASSVVPQSSKAAVSHASSVDDKLGFEAAVVALGLKANVSEAEHPLLCEGLRRQRGELAVSLLVYCKDDPAKLARVMNKILDREVHQLYKTPPPWYAYLAESSSVTLPSSSSIGVSMLLPSSSSSQASTTEVQSSPSGAQAPLMLSSSSAKPFLKLNGGKVHPTLPLATPSAVALQQPSYQPSTLLPSAPSSASPMSSASSLVQSSVGLSLLASSSSASSQPVVDPSGTKKENNETKFTGLKTPSALSSASLGNASSKDCKPDLIEGKAGTLAAAAASTAGHSDVQSDAKEAVVSKEIFEAAAEVTLGFLEGGGGAATASGSQQMKKIVSGMDALDDNFTGDDDDAIGRSKYKEWETRFRCTNLKTTKKPSVGMASIDSSAPETTSSDNSPTLLRRASKQPPTSPPHHHHHHVNNLCPDSDSGSSHESYDFNNSDSLQGCGTAPQRDADSPALSQLFESFYSPQPSSLAHHPLGVVNAKVTRYKGKNRVMPSIPNQPSEALAHFMFELAKTILIKAGGNISTSLFTQHSISFQNSSNNAAAANNNNSSSSNNNGNSNGGTNGPHRALHLCAFQIGLYALGLHNRVSPNWLSRTYSSLVSWIVGQATEIGPAAIKILTQSWERHLTPQEAASLADRASRCRDPSMVSAAAELALSCLSYAHSLNTNEIHIALNQCYDQSSEMLQRACLSVEMAAKEGTVHPEILFEVAKRWYELYTGPVSVAATGSNGPSAVQGENRVQNANPSGESGAVHILPVNQQMVSAANQREDMNVGLQVDSRLQVYPVAPYPMPQFTYQQAQQLYYHQPLLQQSQPPPAIHQQQHFLPPQPSQPPYLPAPSYSYLSIHHPHQQNGQVVALPPGSQSHPYFPQHSVIRHRGQQIMQVNLAPHVVPIQMPPPPAPYQIAFVGQASGAGNPGGCHGNWQPAMFGYQHFQQFPVDPMQAPPPSVMVASLASNNQVHHLQQIQPPLQQQPPPYVTPLSNSGVNAMPTHGGAGSQATSTIYFLYAAYRVGMLAMEALARKVHEDRPQIKYSRNPPYGEDVKWLLEVAIKLGMTHIQQFCASACTAILSPFILYDIAIDTAKAFSSGNMNQVNQNLRLPIVQSLLQKSSQMFVQCTHSRIHHIVAQDYDEFINILYSARKVFVLIPDGLTQFNELINGLKRTKSCKKDLWQKIFGLLS